MKTFSEILMKKSAALLCLALATAFYACGDDSGSSSQDSPEDEAVLDASSSSGTGDKSSSSIEPIVDIKDGPVVDADSIDLSEYEQEGKVFDRRDKKSYNLLVSGITIWIDENLDYKTTHPMSTCYDYADSLCVKYGRLYSDVEEDLCPEGFKLPRAVDYRLLIESKDSYNAQYAGSCMAQSESPMECSDIGETAFYAVQGDSIASISKKGSVKVFDNDERFSSVRCIKEKSIVEKKKELPKCVAAYEGRTVFVIEKDSAYTCTDFEWKNVYEYSACRDGEKYVYSGKKDVLYACTEGKWHMATLDDIDKPCIDENRHKNIVFNGERYSCSRTGWVKLEYPASELGECYSEIFGMVTRSDSNRTYICKNTGEWKLAGAYDLYGGCSGKYHGQIVTIDSVDYFCSTKERVYEEKYYWQSNKGNVNEEHGFCTDDRLSEYVVYADDFYYCTYYNEWHISADDRQYLPTCVSSRWDSTYYVGNEEYWCSSRYKNWQLVKHWLFDGQKDSIGCKPNLYGKTYTLDKVEYICALSDNMFEFRQPNKYELKFGACKLDTLYMVVKDDTSYTCNDGVWSNRKLGVCEADYGTCAKGNNRVEIFGDSACVCYDGSWDKHELEIVEKKFEVCTRENSYVIFYGNDRYSCTNGVVSSREIVATDYRSLFGECKGNLQGKDTVHYGVKFVCDTNLVSTINYDWYRYQEVDSLAGSHCTSKIAGKDVQTKDGAHYKCTLNSSKKKYEWVMQKMSEYMSECNAANKGVVESNGVTRSVCLGDRWAPADTFHVKDERNGNVYAAVTIGGVTWMAEPLSYVPEGKPVYSTRSMNSVAELLDGETAYYSWSVAMGLDKKYDTTSVENIIKENTVVQGVCMDGWHIPTIDEVNKLIYEISKGFTGYSQCFGDDDMVGIHFEKRKYVSLHRNSVTGEEYVADILSATEEMMWTASESYNQFDKIKMAIEVTVAENLKRQNDQYKYTLAPVRCVKDDE